MKTIYTILFFAFVMAFFALAFTFIKISNAVTGIFMPGLIFVAIIACISLLAFLLDRVMNSDDSNNEKLF